MAHHFIATFTEADHPTLHAVTRVTFHAKHHLHAIEAGRLETFITERDLSRHTVHAETVKALGAEDNGSTLHTTNGFVAFQTVEESLAIIAIRRMAFGAKFDLCTSEAGRFFAFVAITDKIA